MKNWRPTVVWVAVAVVVIVVWTVPGIERLAQTAPGWIRSLHLRAQAARLGIWAPVAAVCLLVVHTFIPFPGEVLVAANGALFGFWGGLAVTWVGAMGSACLAFGVGRAVHPGRGAHATLERLLRRVDKTLVERDWTVTLVVRFIPLFPFAVLNFALGRAPVSWKTFLWTTAVGVLPLNTVVVAVGYSAAEAQDLLPWALATLAALTALGLIYRYRIARGPAPSGGDPATPRAPGRRASRR